MRVRRLATVLLGLAPIVAATTIAGLLTYPKVRSIAHHRLRLCITEYTGFTGGPTHVTLGPDGNVWVVEGFNDLIARFDINTDRVTAEYRVPRGSLVHDMITGPDRQLWFAGSRDVLGKLDPSTGKLTLYTGLAGAGQPHLWWAPDGFLYISEMQAGRLARFDPRTGKVTASQYNLPSGSGIHSVAPLPDGNAWWGLEQADKLARFNIHTHTFDKLVALPPGSDPHWTTYVPSDHSVWVALGIPNEFARYDLITGRLTFIKTPLKPASPAQFRSRVPFPTLTHMVVDATGRYLWSTTLGGHELLRVDLRTHHVEPITCGLGRRGTTLVLTRDGRGRIWVSDPLDRAIGKIEP
jgi:streptogramin lyase